MPFTTEEFFDVFRAYNTAIFPAQLFLVLIGVVAVISAGRDAKFSTRLTYSILAILWLWTGLVYHLLFFSRINPAALFFASLCLAPPLLFVH